jgi:hypothetical protein
MEARSPWVVTRGSISPERRDSIQRQNWVATLRDFRRVGAPESRLALPLRLAAGQFLDLRLLRSARILAGLQRFVRFALLARRAFCFLSVFSAQCCCICHELFSELEFVIGRLSNCVVQIPMRPKSAKLLNYQITQFSNTLQAFSSWAYFSTSFFKPKRGNCTVILASSPSPSR